MHNPGKRSLVAVLALVSSSLLVLAGASEASSSPHKAAPGAAPAAAAGAPLGADAVAIARKHVAKHAADYGFSDEDVQQLKVYSVVPTKHNGLTNVYMQQRLHSIEVSTAILNVAVTSDGEVFRVASSALASAGKVANGATPKLSDVAAAERAADALGLRPTKSFASDDNAQGASRERTLSDGGISRDPVTARLVYQETAHGDLRLAWELGINQLDGQHWWQIRMDAVTGAELGKTDWVDADSHNVYPLPTEAPSFGGRVLVSNPATSASPFGWNDTNGVAGAESTLTIGNNVEAYTDLNDDDLPDAGSSPNGGAGLVFNFPLDLTQPPSAYQPAAVSNLYFTINRMHDILYRYGFDEASGNFQVNNYGNGGLGNDSINGEAQDGGGTDNANFATPPDGQEPRMQMYIWTDATPDRDGDLDNGIILHEFGHGVSNRLTGSSVNCLNNEEQAGEGWSDYLAYMLTMPTGTEPAGGRGIGTYALNEAPTGPGIRAFRYSTDMAINPHTYDSIKTAAIPHGVGSVWAAMLWDMTYALIDEHGFDANLVTGNAGNTMSLQLVMDGMKLQPCSPGFVDARDAILDADVAANGGANQCLIWGAFARRGLGFSAMQGSSSSVADGTEAFDLPPSCNGVALTATVTPSPVPAGQQLTYDLHLESTAAGAVNGVSVTSEVGDHATYVPGSANCGGTYNAGTETVTFPIGTMAVGTTRDCELRVAIDSSPFTTVKFEDDFEPNLSNWVATHGAGTFDWSLTTTGPHSPTHAAFSSDPDVVSDQYLRMASPVTVAAGDQLSFWHSRGLESGYDGGVVEVSTNGGSSWTGLAAADFSQNGYNGTISSCCSNPLAGRQAFTGSSPYVRSVASLASYVGQSILVRFRTGSDDSIDVTGWTVDDVHIGNEVFTTNKLTVAATGFPTHSQDLTTQIVAPSGTAPGAPTVNSTTPSPGAVMVAFAPGSNGGSPITGYTVQCIDVTSGVSRSRAASGSPFRFDGFLAGHQVKCRLRATNAIGTGPYSGYGATVTIPPATAPLAPTVNATTPSPGAVTVAFASGGDGGSPITGYTVQCIDVTTGVSRSRAASGSPFRFDGFLAGHQVKCRLRATNAIGTGPYSGYGATVTIPPATAPLAPTVNGTTPSPGAVTVAFASGGDGGSPITGYTVQCIDVTTGVSRSRAASGSPFRFDGFLAAHQVKCRLRATNAIGTGPYSGYGATVTIPPATAPLAPTVNSTTPMTGAVSVAFTSGGHGGSPITGYTVQCVDLTTGVSRSRATTSSPYAFGGFQAGHQVRCRVRATNAIGTGPYSAYGATVTV